MTRRRRDAFHSAIIIRRSGPSVRPRRPASDPALPCPERFRSIVRVVVLAPHRRGRGDGGARHGGCSQPLPLPVFAVRVRREAGVSLKSVARELVARRRPARRICRSCALRAYQSASTASIKAGNYEIAAGITLPRLLDKLTQGDVTQTALTVVEGSTFAELARGARVESGDREDRARPSGGGARADASACRDAESRRVVLSGHVFFRRRLARTSRSSTRAHRLMRAAPRRRVGAARRRFAAQGSVRGADPRVDRRKGNRRARPTAR